jgi:hypothetical protein
VGNIPTEFGLCTAIEQLYLFENQLTGEHFFAQIDRWVNEYIILQSSEFVDFVAPAPSHRPNRVQDVHDADCDCAPTGVRSTLLVQGQARNARDALQEGVEAKTRQSNCAAAGGETRAHNALVQGAGARRWCKGAQNARECIASAAAEKREGGDVNGKTSIDALSFTDVDDAWGCSWQYERWPCWRRNPKQVPLSNNAALHAARRFWMLRTVR